MSKIDELIQGLCPDGVAYEKVGDIAVVGTGRSDKKDATPDGEYPFYVRSKVIARINTFEFDEEAIVIPGEGGIGEIFHYVIGKYALHQRAYRIHFTDSKVIPKFAYYHFMANFKVFIMKKAVSATVTSIRKPMITDFPVPIPPLEVQKEIVNILDKFTQLEAELSAELSAELEARRKQYEYYRNKLLTFNNSVQWVTLGDVGKFYGGLTGKTKADFGTGSGSFITYMNIFSNIAVDTGKVESVKIGETERQNKVEVGDILFTGSSESAEEAGMTSVLTKQTAFPMYLNSFSFGYRFNTEINVDPEFTKHLFRSKAIRKHIIATASGVTRFNISKKRMAKISVPIPPMSDQIRIATILDKFDTLTTDISSGLPAEIHARRQQYEYYRTKLLTFQELSA